MTKYHLNFDGNQNNGIIFNGTYHGALFVGAELKPALSFAYHSFFFTEVFESQPSWVIQTDGLKRLMTELEIAEVRTLAIAWEQPLGQEGNPTLEQVKKEALGKLKSLFSPYRYRPIITTPQGWRLQAGRADKDNLATLLKHGITTVRDADNINRTVTLDELAGLIESVELAGIQSYQTKWQLEQQILDAESLEAVRAISIEA